jgi:ATP-dependent Clp protease ATP-binding subunit ClpX
MLEIMYDMPSQPNIKEVVISEEVVNRNEPPFVVYTKAAESA